jgi:hypothetical protein
VIIHRIAQDTPHGETALTPVCLHSSEQMGTSRPNIEDDSSGKRRKDDR